ncbi:hypothetical protein J5J10_12265 [Ciceribacter sp. L1K23]|uniref:hypothetical protein n=1 Tax=Ciceribacter sp. L1K23 TaxID=2820276 RepID=UPI001B82C2B7|nr:hypothetical protein [Ciceribacter sp. L1K23]MBR0556455.1 hypothetical protein [Ciceribacter sp. L1K23]
MTDTERPIGGLINPLLRILKLPVLPKAYDRAATGIGCLFAGIGLFFGDDVVGYLKQPFGPADTFVISRKGDAQQFVLLKSRTEADGRIDGYICGTSGSKSMSPAFFISFRPMEEEFPIMRDNHFLSDQSSVFIASNIFYNDREYGLIEWWDLDNGVRLESKVLDHSIETCREVYDVMASNQ